jgi:hypothetical protein
MSSTPLHLNARLRGMGLCSFLCAVVAAPCLVGAEPASVACSNPFLSASSVETSAVESDWVRDPMDPSFPMS